MNQQEAIQAQPRRKRGRRRRALWALPIALALIAVGFVVWASIAAQPMPEATAALRSGDKVTVSAQPWYVFRPAQGTPRAGLVIYPGARVDARAYAPQASRMAQDGYLVAIVQAPLNLAFFGTDRAAEVIAASPDVKMWAVGGHSLGGVAAASYARNHQDRVRGIVFWASYPQDADDLSASGLEVTSIYGTRDGLATPAKIDASRRLLPSRTQWVAIEGGNHAQFGWYGPQDGDNPATISREQQQARIVEATEALLARLP